MCPCEKAMSVKISGIESLKKRIKNVTTKTSVSATAMLKHRTRLILNELVLNTPQWSGSTAASWVVEIASYPASKYHFTYAENQLKSDKSDWRKQSPVRKIGDVDALLVSKQINDERISSIRYNSKVSIRNMSPIADELATDPDFSLRPGNFLPGDYLAIQHTVNKFKNLKADIV